MMENGYYIAYEGADTLLLHEEDGSRPREVSRDKDGIWRWLMVMMDQGNEMHKVQYLSFQKGYEAAMISVLNCVDLTKDQEDHIEELQEEGTGMIRVYTPNYEEWV